MSSKSRKEGEGKHLEKDGSQITINPELIQKIEKLMEKKEEGIIKEKLNINEKAKELRNLWRSKSKKELSPRNVSICAETVSNQDAKIIKSPHIYQR